MIPLTWNVQNKQIFLGKKVDCYRLGLRWEGQEVEGD